MFGCIFFPKELILILLIVSVTTELGVGVVRTIINVRNFYREFICRTSLKNGERFSLTLQKKIGKLDPEVYVDSGKWKARQGGNGLVSANDVKLRFTNCTTEEHAKIYQLNRPFDNELIGMFVPFGKIAPELGNKLLHETLVLDYKTNVPILSITPFNQGSAVKIKTLNVAEHDSLQRMASYQLKSSMLVESASSANHCVASERFPSAKNILSTR